MGRNRIHGGDVPVLVRMSPELAKSLAEVAKATGNSRNTTITLLLARALKEPVTKAGGLA